MTPTILCLSRAYLSRLFPAMEARHPDARYIHIVQTNAEDAYIRSRGGEVAFSIEGIVREAVKKGVKPWVEPADFRDVTGFPWSPIHSDRYLPSFKPQTRLQIAAAIFSAIEEVFARETIHAVLSEPVALFVTHCLFYQARKAGARPLFWANTWFPGWFYFAQAVDISRPVRRSQITASEALPLQTIIPEYLDGVAANCRGPAYHPSFASKLSPLSYFNQRRGEEPLVLQGGLRSRVIQHARLFRAKAARATFPAKGDFMSAGSVAEHRFYLRSLQTRGGVYDELPQGHDSDNVTYPLQFEPEASLLYFAPAFRDQTVVVENILRALPPGKILWVKEHPNQFGALGHGHWPRLRKIYGNLRFVHGREDGRALLRNSGLVVTVSSSAGMDALALGRRALVLGSVFYRNYPGAVPISSFSELAEDLQRSELYVSADNRDQLISALHEFGQNCYPGDPQPSGILYDSDNLDLLVRAVRVECAAGKFGHCE